MQEEVKAIIEAVIITVLGLSLLGTITGAVTSALTSNVTSNAHFASVITIAYVVPLAYILIILVADFALLYKAFKD